MSTIYENLYFEFFKGKKRISPRFGNFHFFSYFVSFPFLLKYRSVENYYLLLLLPRLSLYTVLGMQGLEHLSITDINGQVYQIRTTFLSWVLGVGWVFQALAVVINILCYLMHPMKVELDPRGKMFIHVLGTKRSLKGRKVGLVYNFSPSIS